MVMPDVATWRALVDKELAGASFEKLVALTAEGIALQPLYTEGPEPSAAVRGQASQFLLAMRVDDGGTIADDVGGGADALWISGGDRAALAAAIAHDRPVIVEAEHAASASIIGARAARCLVVANDPVTRAARAQYPVERLAQELDELARTIHRGSISGLRVARASSLPFHEAGADTADELALVLSSGVAYLRAFDANGFSVADANAMLALQISVGRDTFGELCKLRALRACWHRVLAASGAETAAMPPIHAVCSTRTLAQRDPWVNMLRVTTQLFSAILGGADWITPASFDDALDGTSPLGRRVARNTALVLRDESYLGRVLDAAGGSYYIETRTDALAREAWKRFQEIERDGGIVKLLESGALAPRLAASWEARATAIAKRKEPVLGVSEFANLGEKLPTSAAHSGISKEAAVAIATNGADSSAPLGRTHAAVHGALPRHRDAERFEQLRTRVEAAPPRVAAILLGPPAEHRGRAGYAAGFFATAGLRVREIAWPATWPEHADDIAVICGSDERYAESAVNVAQDLRAAGMRRVVLAGRPGALEAALREAGVDAFIFVGCDVVATLTDLVGGAA